MELVLQQLVNALTLGAIYALIALGYTMVYGVLRLINFAHGEMFMLGAYAAFALLALALPKVGPPGALLAVIVFFGVFAIVGMTGVVTERVAYRPLRQSVRLAPMLSSLGISLSLLVSVQILAGPQPITFPSFFPAIRIDVLGVSVTTVQLGIVAAALVLMAALHIFVSRTRLGVVMRAVSENLRTAQLLGINIDRAISLIFFIGPGLGALGGILYSTYYGVMFPSMGAIVGLKAFTAAILGGVGSIPGAMIGGFMLGLLEVFGTVMLPILTGGHLGSEYRDVFAFTALILVLLFRPAGLLGEQVSEESMVYKKDF
jgi:branched-chain amino acid transport system permease protein